MSDYNPFDHATQEDPYPVYERLLAGPPVYHDDEHDFHALPRHADVEAALRDAATYSSSHGVTLDLWTPEASRVMGFLATDRPDHTRVRRLLVHGFTPRRVAGQGDGIRALTRHLLAEPLERRTFDIAEWMAQIPSRVVSQMIGVPGRDRPQVSEWTRMLVERPGEDGGPPEAFFRAQGAVKEYMTDLLRRRRRLPGDDMMSALAEASEEGDRLTDREIVSALGLILAAGHETTVKVLVAAWWQAAVHPDQKAVAWAGGIEGWREETLRHSGPVQTVVRRATRDVELHGHKIPEGSKVVLMPAAANRDPRVFPDPSRYDLTRDTSATVVTAFGHGPHFCLGAALARLTVRVVLEELVAAVADYEIDEDSVRHVHSPNIRGLRRLVTTIRPR